MEDLLSLALGDGFGGFEVGEDVAWVETNQGLPEPLEVLVHALYLALHYVGFEGEP